MYMKRVAIVGYGNIGKYVLEALEVAPDFEIAGVVRRSVSGEKPLELTPYKVVTDIKELGKVDVAILATPTRSVEENAKKYLAMGINTVDSFDIHGDIWNLHESLGAVAKANNTVAIISAGWDPGSDSVIRTLLQSAAPKGLTWTNFGPGMSMGHSVVARSKKGVKNALSMTMPQGAGIHSRLVYVELEDGYTKEQVYDELKADDYFAHDELHVIPVDSVDNCRDMGHGVLLERKGVSGKTQNQRFKFEMTINNPALTAQILVGVARATFKQNPGAYTMPEVPVMDLLPGDKEQLIRTLV
ncbi:MAG: diaminopimelate dehydrogenase [Bacteroidales bacterium]|nr:diaminopimelate dehydrogenase [Bacteroidales bacterium]